jgi:cell division protein FtsN
MIHMLCMSARNAQANLKAQGAMAQVISVKQDGRLYYQLRLGPYGTKLLASETLTAMQHRGFEGFYRKTN